VLVADDGTSQVYNLYGLDLISQDSGSDVRTLLVDGLGSVRTEMVGTVVDTATTYSPYGEVLKQAGTSGTDYGFTGEQEDSATGGVAVFAGKILQQRAEGIPKSRPLGWFPPPS
jgi:hypothetical protein